MKTGQKAANTEAVTNRAGAKGVNDTIVEINADSIFEPERPANPQYPKAQENKESEINNLILSLNENKQTKESFVNDLADKLIDIIGLTDPKIKDNLKTQLVRDLTPSTTIGNIKQYLGNVSENDRYLRRVNLTILDLLNPQSKKYGKFTKDIPSYQEQDSSGRTQLYLYLENAITKARTSLTDPSIVPRQTQQSAQLDAIVKGKDQAARLANLARQSAERDAAYKATANRVAAVILSEEAARNSAEEAARVDATMHERRV